MKYQLLISVVPHDKGELITKAAVEAGSTGGTVLMGRGISGNSFVTALGLGGTSEDIVYILTDDSQIEKISSSIKKAVENEKQNFGQIFSISTNNFLKNGTVNEGENKMAEEKSLELITVILNKGYADDAMAAARKAGAGGGTVINARGTAKEGDAKFFGMQIVPEKEMLLIVVDSDKKTDVFDAIKKLPCLAEPGSGIAFCSEVNDFALLGKSHNE
ncbi:MAG: P-II family nitrogen regulator [Treponema sp.]